jgi:phosphoglycerate kinase
MFSQINPFVQDSDIELAKELVEQDKTHKKILEMQVLVESDTLDGRFEGKFRTINVKVYDTQICT